MFSQQARVFGKVLSHEGFPAEDVLVSVANSTLTPVYTDADGKYSIQIPANQEVLLIFSNLNYETHKKKLELKEGDAFRYSPSLVFKNLLGVVEKTEEHRDNSTIYIQPKQYFQLPGASTDISRIILSQGLGVQSSNELSSGYSVRGGSYDENLVYVNDIEVYRPFLVRSGQQEGLSFANPDMVSNILFSAGGFEAKYGDKLSSVLDITYRKPRTFNATVAGSLLGANAHVESTTKNKLFSWQLGARYKTNQYLLKSIDTKGDYRPNFFDCQSILFFDINEKLGIELLGNVSSNKYVVIPQTRETVFGTFNQALSFTVYFDGQEVSSFLTGLGAASITYKPFTRLKDSLRLKLIASVYKAGEKETFTVQGQYFIDELENDFGSSNFGNVAFNRGIGTFINHGRNYLDAWVANIEHKGRYQKRRSELSWGIRYQQEKITDRLSEWNYVDSAGYSVPQLDPNVLELRDVLKTKIQIESARTMGYLQYQWQKNFSDSSYINITGGVRSNYWTYNGQNVISPRLVLSFKPGWFYNWVFKAGAGYYYQPPFYRELRDLDGKINPDVKAQESIHYTLSADCNFRIWKRPFKFIIATYYKQMNNLIPYEIDNVRIRYYANNNARGYATGIDFRLNGEFVKGLESWASMSIMTIREDIRNDYYYTYTDTSGNPWYPNYSQAPKADSVLHTPGFIPRPTDQRVTFNLFFQDYLPRLPDFKMHLNLIFGTGLPFGPPDHVKYRDTLRMPPYRRVDIGFSYQLLKEGRAKKPKNIFRFINSAWLSLEVLNLLAVNNVVSYTWVKDVTNRQYAIPNYLTNRQLNVKLQLKF
jgi:hypothetical protein